MRSDIFQRALEATARVACCVSLLAACQKTDEKIQEPTKTNNNQPTSTATDPLTLEECREHTVAAYTSKTATPNEYTDECCQMIAKDYDQSEDPMAGQSKWAERGECCGLLQWQGSMACTPWGPPCPPAMA
jgi:hypothetical protein